MSFCEKNFCGSNSATSTAPPNDSKYPATCSWPVRRPALGITSGDAETSGRRVTCKARLAHLVGGSDRSEVSPTAILQDTHSLEGMFCERRHVFLGSSQLAAVDGIMLIG